MDFTDIASARLANQQISNPSAGSPAELLSHMGALQAQDYRMVKWAMGIRVPGATKEIIEQAIADGTIIRTHLLRPTWHFVAAKDLRWLLKLTAPRVKVKMRHRHKYLGLTDELTTKSNTVIAEALAANKYLSRKELVAELENAGFENEDNMASHLLLRAELDGVICSGPSRGKRHTYALLNERVPQTEKISKEEALERLAQTYFGSHGPATLEDFVWWSGLTKTSARKALEMIKPDFTSQKINSKTYWFTEPLPTPGAKDTAYLLPAYDEFIISYRNQDMIIPDDKKRKKAILNNGIFRPIIVVNGQVLGIWKRKVQKDAVRVETHFFNQRTGKIQALVKEAAAKFAAFLGKKLAYTSNNS